ncbi:MAG TPA: hypothetical protein VGM10_17555 [Actinocrinis sp.]|jgi:hypothetical protein
MAIYYVIARMDGTRQVGPDRQTVNLSDALARGITHFIQVPEPEPEEDDEPKQPAEPYGLLVYPQPAQAGLGVADDMTLTLGVDGAFRLFQLQGVPAPEHFTPSSAVGAEAIVTREFLVTAEVPSWWAYGPNGRHVLGLIYSLTSLRRNELDAIGHRIDAAGLDFAKVKFVALAEADRAIAGSSRTGAARLARGYARAATYGTWDRDSALGHAASLAGDIAHVLSVGDKVTEVVSDSMTGWLRPQIAELHTAGDGPDYGDMPVFEPPAEEEQRPADIPQQAGPAAQPQAAAPTRTSRS